MRSDQQETSGSRDLTVLWSGDRRVTTRQYGSDGQQNVSPAGSGDADVSGLFIVGLSYVNGTDLIARGTEP